MRTVLCVSIIAEIAAISFCLVTGNLVGVVLFGAAALINAIALFAAK